MQLTLGTKQNGLDWGGEVAGWVVVGIWQGVSFITAHIAMWHTIHDSVAII